MQILFSNPTIHRSFRQPEIANDNPRTPFPSPRFEGVHGYTGPIHRVNLLTDFNDGASNTEVERQFERVVNYVQSHRQQLGSKLPNTSDNGGKSLSRSSKSRFLEVKNLEDNPPGNTDYAALSLLRLASQPNQEIFIHVTDPGVGNVGITGKQQHDRSILVTDGNGIFIGPNNGSLGLLTQSLSARHIPFKLLPIDLRKVQDFDRIRLGNPYYRLPNTFHARDVFAVVAGAIAGGLPAETFADETRLAEFQPRLSGFSSELSGLSLKAGEQHQAHGLQDKTRGNIKTNLTISDSDFESLLDQKARYQVEFTDTRGAKQKFELPLCRTFSEVPKGQLLIYQGSTESPEVVSGSDKHLGARRFVEIAVNLGDAAKALNIDPEDGGQFKITRIQ